MSTTFMPGQKMLVRVKKTFVTVFPEHADCSVLIGSRTYTHADGPFEVDADRAELLIKQGLVDAVAEHPMAKAQRAVEPKLDAQRR